MRVQGSRKSRRVADAVWPIVCVRGSRRSKELVDGLLSAMLQRLNSSLDEELDGIWSRERLIEMDVRYVATVEAAFEAGLESRAAAVATVNVNGRQRLTEEGTIELAWRWFTEAKFQATALEVMARCPGVAPERVRVGFKQRLFSRVSHTSIKDHWSLGNCPSA